MYLPGRHESVDPDGYRYGFQGQELDNEVKGEGNSYNYTFRMHDPRLGRFFAVDPLSSKYPWYTPYSFSGNKVIAHVEIEGLEDAYYLDKNNEWINAGKLAGPIISMNGNKVYSKEQVIEIIAIQSLESVASNALSMLRDNEKQKLLKQQQAAYDYQVSTNLFGLMYKLSPAEPIVHGSLAISEGKYLSGSLLIGLGLLELSEISPLVKPLIKGELAVGTTRDLQRAGSVGDDLTPHHVPSANHMKKNHDVSSKDAISIMLYETVPAGGGRHVQTGTFGNQSDLLLDSRSALAQGIMDLRRILKKDGLYNYNSIKQLMKLVSDNKKKFPEIFEKK